MEDPLAPASARVSAARTVLELSGDLNNKDNENFSDKSLAELTPDQLSQMISYWEEEKLGIKKTHIIH